MQNHENTQIKIIELPAGDPLQRGRVYGEEAKDLIKGAVSVYKQLFGEKAGQTWRRSQEIMFPYLEAAKRHVPHLVTELEGVAQGAGIPFNDVFAINCRSEILFRTPLNDECTSLGALPPATVGEGVIVAQNWDWYEELIDFQVLLIIPRRGPIPPLATFTEAGQLAKSGLNGAGLGLAVNNLRPDQSSVGVPWLLITRLILESANFTTALGAILRNPRGHAIHYLLAQYPSMAVSVETNPIKDNIIWPTQGILSHANHFIGACEGFKDLKLVQDPAPSTFQRWWSTNSLMNKNQGSITVDVVKEVLRDHTGHPFSVCWHQNPDCNDAFQNCTCLSVIMELDKNLLHYTKGNPCQQTYKTIALGPLWGRAN